MYDFTLNAGRVFGDGYGYFRSEIAARLNEMMRRAQMAGMHDFVKIEPTLTPQLLEDVLSKLTPATLPRRVDVLIRLAEICDHNPLWFISGIGDPVLAEVGFGNSRDEDSRESFRRALRTAAKFAFRWKDPGSVMLTLWTKLDWVRRQSLQYPNAAEATSRFPESDAEMLEFWNRWCGRRRTR